MLRRHCGGELRSPCGLPPPPTTATASLSNAKTIYTEDVTEPSARLRGVASALVYVESRWNRLQGYHQIPALISALESAYHYVCVRNGRWLKPMPHKIIRGRLLSTERWTSSRSQ